MNTRYLLKLWVSVIFITPAFFILVNFLFKPDPGIHLPYSQAYLLAVVMGALLLAAPALILFLFIAWFVEQRTNDPVALKVFYIVTSLLCMFITFQIAGGNYSGDYEYGGVSVVFYYAASIVLFGLIYKLKKIHVELKKDEIIEQGAEG